MYQVYMIFKHKARKLDSFKYCHVSLTIQLNINPLFLFSSMIKQFYFKQFNFLHKSKVNISKYCHVSPKIQLNISPLFSLSSMIKQFYFKQFNFSM